MQGMDYRTCALSDENGTPALTVASQPIHWAYVGEAGNVMRVKIYCPEGEDAEPVVAAHADVSWTGTEAEAATRWGVTEVEITGKRTDLAGYH